MPGPVGDSCGIREAVCIHTRKIFDSCRDKDCIEDLRFYPKLSCVETLNRAQSVKAGSAKLLYVYVDVEPVSFNRGFYTVDMRFFYQVTLQAYLNCSCPVTVEGLCVFDKRAILFGSEGSAKIFSSQMRVGECDAQLSREANTPIAVVEAVDPIVLDARIVDCCGRRDCDCDLCEVPSFINECFSGELSSGDEGRRVYETVRAANAAAEAMIRPGVLLCDVDRAARSVIEDAGYGPYFTHRLGHGCGLECHEPPDNSPVSMAPVRPGMVFSVEPGIYLPGKLGVRIEDLVLVTEDGCEVLNHAGKELQIV